MRESALVAKILVYLKGVPGCWAVKLHGSNFQRAGLPDLLVIHRMDAGVCVHAWEVKACDGQLTPLQRHTLDRMRAAGAATAVVRSVDEARRLLEGNG